MKRLFGMFLLMASTASAQVRLGIDQLKDDNFRELAGRRVALITNQTGVDRAGDSTVDLLRNAPYVKLVCVMTPEHGFRGVAEHGQKVLDWIDPVTKLPIYSLYGSQTRPTDKMLRNVDTIVFDIQDVGTRFYTYITTMGMAMEEAAKRKMRFVVLDRPNPIRGDIIEGDILDADIKRMTGYFELPVRHGLTVGEIALWTNKQKKIGADLTVVPLSKWNRSDWYDHTGLAFFPPSPNIRTVNAAVLYPGVGCFEATNVSVGRGTDTPFEIFGAPWIQGIELSAALRAHNFPGVLVEPVSFIPKKDIYAGQKCEGVRLTLTDRGRARPFHVFVAAFEFLAKKYPGQFVPDWEEVRVVTGSNRLKETIESGSDITMLLNAYEEKLAGFRKQIAPYFLY